MSCMMQMRFVVIRNSKCNIFCLYKTLDDIINIYAIAHTQVVQFLYLLSNGTAVSSLAVSSLHRGVQVQGCRRRRGSFSFVTRRSGCTFTTT